MITSIFSMYRSFEIEQKVISQKLKEKALREYELALKMPRKKKKVAKKSAIMLYDIACHAIDTLILLLVEK